MVYLFWILTVVGAVVAVIVFAYAALAPDINTSQQIALFISALCLCVIPASIARALLFFHEESGFDERTEQIKQTHKLLALIRSDIEKRG